MWVDEKMLLVREMYREQEDRKTVQKGTSITNSRSRRACCVGLEGMC